MLDALLEKYAVHGAAHSSSRRCSKFRRLPNSATRPRSPAVSPLSSCKESWNRVNVVFLRIGGGV